MLFILLPPLLILLCTLLLHYYQHFKIEFRSKSVPKLRNRAMNVSKDKLQRKCNPPKLPSFCHCCVSLRPKDDETYNFFPASFFYIVIVKIIICALIISLDVIDSNHQYTRHHIFGGHSPETYHDKQSWTAFESVHGSNSEGIFLVILDYIFIYSVMIFSIWESLFPFFKYYTTYNVVINVESASTADVIMRFMVYAVVFALLFVMQIHIYYYLWPVLLLLHIVFNWVCVTKFTSMLISRYQIFIDIEERIDNNDNANVLHNVYTMRRISAICTCLQTAALALFIITYSVHIIYYLPLLWCISTSIYSLNFIRNRKYFIFKLFECSQKIKYHPSVSRRHESSRTKDSKRTSKTVTSGKETPAILITCGNFSDVALNDEHKSATKSTTTSNEHSVSGLHVTFAGEVKTTTYEPDNSVSRRTTSKALQILGIQTQSKSLVKRFEAYPKLHNTVKSQSDILSSPSSEVPISPPIKLTYSKSDITPQNHACHRTKSAEDVHESEAARDESEFSRSYVPQIPLRSQSIASPTSPCELAIAPPEFPNIHVPKHCMEFGIDIDAIEYINSGDDEGEVECECVFVDYNTPKTTETDYDDVGTAGVVAVKHQKQTPLSLRHQKSNSDPVVINDILNNLNTAQVMDSLDLFAKYGFCSRNSINSLYQLARYRNKIHQ